MTYQLWAFTQAGAQAAVLENAFSISRGKEANATGSLSFSLPDDDPKAAYITTAYEIKVWNTPTSWFWSFGDGTYNETQNPEHTYSTSGFKTVALTATNSAGSNVTTRVKFVRVN
jgi:PKD repeat protein